MSTSTQATQTPRTCAHCRAPFDITEADHAFYAKMKVPPPTHCPACRLQRRLAWRNERALTPRTCTKCQKNIISFYQPDTPFPVYCQNCWWGDDWDPRDYGQPYDFNRPFFDQFAELLRKTPKMAMLVYKSENCDYNSLIGLSKNCYMSPGTYQSEDCLYSRKSQFCRDAMDNLLADHCERIYECVDSAHCFSSTYLLDCKGCRDSHFLEDCNAVSNCFMSVGLRHKEFHIKNKPHSKEEYSRKVNELLRRPLKELREEFNAFRKQFPKRAQIQIQCENASGDHLQNCKNARFCYDSLRLEDCAYMVECVDNKDCMDLSMHDEHNELSYEVITGGDRNRNTAFCVCPVNSQNVEYSYAAFYLKNGFGCDSIPRRMEHLILNKQYSKEDYDALLPRVIDHMTSTDEYGEFFPISFSPFPYNESVAQDRFPLTREQALTNSYRWKEPDPKEYRPQTVRIPARIEDVPDSITNELLACGACGKNYKILIQELRFYRKMNLPIPDQCPDCRHKRRLSLKNPHHLWNRTCGQCGKAVQTTYAPDRAEIVVCEACYLKERY